MPTAAVSTARHHLAAAYALDALDDEERRCLEAHCPACDLCNEELSGFRETAGRLGAVTETAPPTSLRVDVLADISRTRQIAPREPERVAHLSQHSRRRSQVSWGSALVGAVAATLVALIGLVALGGVVADPDDGELVALLVAPDATVSTLPAIDPGTDTGALSVVWSALRESVAVVGDGGAALRPDRTYVLWAIDAADRSSPSLLFTPDDRSSTAAVGAFDGAPDRWGVTVEPAGGARAPTSDLIYLSA